MEWANGLHCTNGLYSKNGLYRTNWLYSSKNSAKNVLEAKIKNPASFLNRELSCVSATNIIMETSIFGEKMGVAATMASKGLGLEDPTKKLARWVDLLGQPLSQKPVLKI